MKAEEKPRRNGGRSLDIRSNTPSSKAMYGAMPAGGNHLSQCAFMKASAAVAASHAARLALAPKVARVQRLTCQACASLQVCRGDARVVNLELGAASETGLN